LINGISVVDRDAGIIHYKINQTESFALLLPGLKACVLLEAFLAVEITLAERRLLFSRHNSTLGLW
jgi:hypothetical protein